MEGKSAFFLRFTQGDFNGSWDPSSSAANPFAHDDTDGESDSDPELVKEEKKGMGRAWVGIGTHHDIFHSITRGILALQILLTR